MTDVDARSVGGEVGARLADLQAQLWTPARLYDDLALWLDAQDEDTLTKSDVDSDGTEEVEVWEDKSGNGNDASQSEESRRPKFTGDGVRFDGVDDSMSTNRLLEKRWTVAALVRQRDVDGNSEFAGQYKDSSKFDTGLYVERASNRRAGIFVDPDSNEATGTPSSEMSLYVWERENTTAKIYRDGTEILSATGLPDGPSSDLPFTIGGFSAVKFSSEIDVTFIVVVGSALTTEKQLRLEGSLVHKADRNGLVNPLANLRSDHKYKDSPPTA